MKLGGKLSHDNMLYCKPIYFREFPRERQNPKMNCRKSVDIIGILYIEAKRICEAERKRKERKARAKGLSSDSAQSEFTCSICNRQFRAKIGLYSH